MKNPVCTKRLLSVFNSSLFPGILLSTLVLILLFLGMTFSSSIPQSSALSKRLFSHVQRSFKLVCGRPGGHAAHCQAHVVTLDSAGTPLAGATPSASSYGPTQFHIAYNLPCAPNGAVQGICATPVSFGPQTIAIVDAFHTPTLENDLNVYSSYYGIPACTKANGCLSILSQTGTSALPTTVNGGWSLEASLDAQAAHAICQTCKILFIEANSNSFNDLATGVSTAANMGATAISNSYGGSEWSGEGSFDAYYNHPGIAVTVSSGDSGYGPEFPAGSSSVVSVGGTTLNVFTDNTYSSETAWSSAGSGCSTFETANTWQAGLNNWSLTGCGTKRAISDVSADADPNTGAAVYDSTPYGATTGWYQVGGTSLSAPLIAGVYALTGGLTTNTNAASVLYANYSLANFHDVTSGTNGTCSTVMCLSGTGFDGPTGLGSPNGILGFMNSSISATPTPTLIPTVSLSPTASPSPSASPTPSPVSTLHVTVTNPLNGATVRRTSNISIQASVTDNAAVTKVEFYVNNMLRCSDTTAPYSCTWRVPNQRTTFALSAKAYDVLGGTSLTSISVRSN